MSAIINIKGTDLHDVLFDISPLIPSGSTEVPIGFHLIGDTLTIVCVAGCVYQSELSVNNEDNTEAHCTVLYHDITAVLHTKEELQLEFMPVGLSITGSDFDITLPMGYSVVDIQEVPVKEFKAIPNQGYLEGFKTLTHVGLDKLFKVNEPVIVNKDISIQKYPCVWIQTRTIGLPFEAVLDMAHIKLLTRFKPTHVSDDRPGTLVFKNEHSVLQLPAKVNNTTESFVSLIEDMKDTVQLDITHYVDRIKAATKTDSKSHCKVTLYAGGIKTSVSHNKIEMALKCGNTSSDVVTVFSMPLQLWLTMLRCLDSDVIEILAGGQKICLRTLTTAIVAHVLI